MNYIIESIFIGIYSVIIFSIVYRFLKHPFYLVLFILGLLKHGLGYILGIQDYYCRTYKNPTAKSTWPTIYELFLEAFLFIIIGLLLAILIKNKYIIVFLTGIILHITFELVGLHEYFIKTHCAYKG